MGRGAGSKSGALGPGSALADQNADPDVVKRMMIIKKSKSSLLIPLLVPFRPAESIEEEEDSAFYNTNNIRAPEFKLVGSLELYKYHF